MIYFKNSLTNNMIYFMEFYKSYNMINLWNSITHNKLYFMEFFNP